MKLFKAGESHGAAMVGMLIGVPEGIPVDENRINNALKERNLAYGRSARQKAELDEIALITGVSDGVTIGNNLAFVIKNNVRTTSETDCVALNAENRSGCKNAKNECPSYKSKSCDCGLPPLTELRPGHADLPGVVKYGLKDARNIAEGSSARNTCLDVAAGEVALSMLENLGVSVAAFVRSVGDCSDNGEYSFNAVKDCKSPFFSPSEEFSDKFRTETDRVRELGDTVGGVVELRVKGIKAGLGSYKCENRVNGAIAADLMSVQAVKGVYFGVSPFNKGLCGSEYADKLISDKATVKVETSNSGGIDGGMTNGAEIVVTVGIKPIPTTKKGVPSVDVFGNACLSAKERADITAVFALCPILKARIALTLCNCIINDLGGDSLKNIAERYSEL